MLKVLWDLEEAVALYDVYFQNGRRLDIADEKLQELHQMYQRRAQILGIKTDEKYRNLAGLRMQLGCIHYVVTGGAEGMSSASRLFYETYALYRSDLASFQRIRDEFYKKYK